jgi:hypothetical protein
VRQLGRFINTRTWRNLRLLFTRCASRQTLHLDPCSRHFRLHMQDGKSHNRASPRGKETTQSGTRSHSVYYRSKIEPRRTAEQDRLDRLSHRPTRRTRGTRPRFAAGGHRACTDHIVTCCRCMVEKLACGAHNLDWYLVAVVRDSEIVSRYSTNVHSERFHVSMIWRWRRRMKQKRPTPTRPNDRKIGQGSRAKAFVSDCALDGPSAADRQPSPGAEMIDRGNKSSQAALRCSTIAISTRRQQACTFTKSTARLAHALRACM